MPIITIEIPEDIASLWERIPETERNNFAVTALRRELHDGEVADDFSDVMPPSEDDMAALGRALAQADAGLGMESEEFFARLSQRIRQ